VREWETSQGEVLSEHPTGHCDTVSGFIGVSDEKSVDEHSERAVSEPTKRTITSSWDGTIRMRSLARRAL
jgi:hypothetical protein